MKKKKKENNIDVIVVDNIESHRRQKLYKKLEYLQDYITKSKFNSDLHFAENELSLLPLCINCGDKLANASMVPNKLKRHLETKHSSISTKYKEYFINLHVSLKKRSKKNKNQLNISVKAQMTSYLLAQILAKKNRQTHKLGENTIKQSCLAIVKTFFGDKHMDEIEKIHLSINTIGRRLQDMSDNIKFQMKRYLKKRKFCLLFN
ncbi:SCAN domain-containing protein 3 [Dictyocoela muelleri]|nr:SCAN domain-containing protein 3 [Dictyocoela muelleri]